MESNNDTPATHEEIKQLEQELSKMEHNLCEEYYEAGKGILEIAEQENKKINSLVDKIIEIRRKLAEVKQEKDCPECTASNDHNSLYCKRCGAKLPDTNDIKEDNNGTK